MTPPNPLAGSQAPPQVPQQPSLPAPKPPPQIAKAFAPQIKLSKNELSRLASRIQQDYHAALSDHDDRMRRFQGYYLRFRNRTETPALGEEEMSNYRVPLIQWQTYAKHAKEMSSLFGADAEITARPVGPDDARRVRKISRFMNWRVFNSIRIQNAASTFNFRKILFGRSHAYAPWRRETFDVPMQAGGTKKMTHYDGPGFEPLWPDDFIVPAEDVESLHDFSFIIRRYRATPDDLLDGEDQGRYQGIQDDFEAILNYASSRKQRDYRGEQIKREKDLSEGIIYQGGLSAAHSLIVHEWHGKWRMLKGRQDATEDNLKKRDVHETDLVIAFIPDMNKIVGVQDLSLMFPGVMKRRPFVETSLVKDGSYWNPSYGEMLENMEAELSMVHNLSTQGMQFSVGPVIFYKPASGFEPETFQMQPGVAVASEDPNGVKVVSLAGPLEPAIQKSQELIGYSERVTGQTDQNMGRTQDRPNAPRTARQTTALLEEGDVRASLEMSVLREDWGAILTHFWQLEKMYGSPSTFFRVTEEDAGGLFPVARGGAYMTEEDRTGEYDFDLKLATSAVSKEQNKQNQLALYQLDIQNPLVVNNPRALWMSLDKIHKSFGDDNFADVIPEPADIGLPVNPREEWTRCLEGDEIFVNPMDNDQLHIADHNRRLGDAAKDPARDPRAYDEMVVHVQEHIRQMMQKQLMQSMVQGIAQGMQSGQGFATGQPPPSLTQLQGHLQEMTGKDAAGKPLKPEGENQK